MIVDTAPPQTLMITSEGSAQSVDPSQLTPPMPIQSRNALMGPKSLLNR